MLESDNLIEQVNDDNKNKEKQIITNPKVLAQVVHKTIFSIMGTPEREDSFAYKPLAELTLVESGAIDETALINVYSQASTIPILEEQDYSTISQFPEATSDFLNNSCCLPVAWDHETITLAINHPYQCAHLAFLWLSMFQRKTNFLLVRRSFIERNITSLYDTMATNEEDWQHGDSEQALKDLAREAPIVRMVNDMFTRAIEMGASDIHVEPAEENMAVRLRVDGVLQTVQTPPMSQYPAVSSRIKLLAGLNIAERRLPQDGRIDLKLGNVQLDIRVSTVPSMYGESIVLRLLQKDTELFELSKIGLQNDTKLGLTTLFNQPHGMILVVGPTGSGKTTTLYCIMKVLNSDSRKIITIEDPVEYQLAGLTQIHVKAQIGLTFANGLRSIVRQDPDIILVGEIRDKETAEIAIQAALTGHLVLSTLHTNDAAGAISRLLDMGIESFLISSSLLGVLSQRLVRRICPQCQGKGKIEVINEFNISEEKRCRNCLSRGYRGRVGIYELLLVDDQMRKAINMQKDSSEIAEIACKNGMRTLRQDGYLKVQEGITTDAEIARVCKLDFNIQ